MSLNTLALLPSRLAPRTTSASALFAGDAGETMQLAGKRFARQLARGNGARPPATQATLSNLSPGAAPAYRVWFGAERPAAANATTDVLVAFNDAALRSHASTLASDGLLLVNTAQADAATLSDDRGHDAIAVDFDALAALAAGTVSLDEHDLARCRNYAALGVVCALLKQPIDGIRCRTANTAPAAVRANRRALAAGHQHGESLATLNVQPVAARFAA